MSAIIGSGINLAGLHMEDWHFPFLISGTVVAADVGKAVALDTGASNTVKLAGDGDDILGRLEVYEDRVVEGIKVATVALKGVLKMPYKTGETISVGDAVQGSDVAGKVKALAEQDIDEGGSAQLTVRMRSNKVIDKDATNETVTVILF